MKMFVFALLHRALPGYAQAQAFDTLLERNGSTQVRYVIEQVHYNPEYLDINCGDAPVSCRAIAGWDAIEITGRYVEAAWSPAL